MEARKGSFDQLANHTKATFPVKPGDRVRVHTKIKEGERERIQPFEGVVLAVRGRGTNRTFTVRRIGANALGIERIFPVNSPYLVKIEVLGNGDYRRAKLYYLRNRIGRQASKIDRA